MLKLSQAPFPYVLRLVSVAESPRTHSQCVKYASMTSAVQAGLNKSRKSRSSTHAYQRANATAKKQRIKDAYTQHFRSDDSSSQNLGDPLGLGQRNTKTKKFLVPPKAIPYTTASSEFIYGTSAVQAALRCGRRKLYTLYVYEGADEDSLSFRSDSRQSLVRSLCKFGWASGVRVKFVQGSWLDMLDKMSGGRPHNGFVLEASPLPRLPVTHYESVSPSSDHFSVSVSPQSMEEAAVNGTDGRISRRISSSNSLSVVQKRHAYPFTLLLEGILDPGNVGAIIRTAYYFGADAIGITTRNSAPISAVTIKSSAGAAENIPIFSIQNPAQLIEKSQRNGWRFFAAESPDVSHNSGKNKKRDESAISKPILQLLDLRSKLDESPCVLMLGSEERGLNKHIREKADAYVGIQGIFTGTVDEDRAGVDSLNVSVASALLCDAFLGTSSRVSSVSTNKEENTTEKIF